jgi:hypothetical protein
MRGGRGGLAGSQRTNRAVHRSPNKLWRSNSIFSLWLWVRVNLFPLSGFGHAIRARTLRALVFLGSSTRLFYLRQGSQGYSVLRYILVYCLHDIKWEVQIRHVLYRTENNRREYFIPLTGPLWAAPRHHIRESGFIRNSNNAFIGKYSGKRRRKLEERSLHVYTV